MALPANQRKVSFRAKTESKCPVCGTMHAKEELMSGSGRLIAGNLTGELRRLYEPSKKWGKIYPLAYAVQVCPKCLYAAYPKDFSNANAEEVKGLKATIQHRQKLIQTLFGALNFNEDRQLVLGVASFLLAVDCYHLRSAEIAPTIKKAVSCMRAAWLLDDLFQDAPYRPYDKVKDFYYMEASKAYRATVEASGTSDAEPDAEAVGFASGPDLDKNFGFIGIQFLYGLLTHKYIDQLAPEKNKVRLKVLTDAKRAISKVYGGGKATKEKPQAMIDIAKDAHDAMGEMIGELEAELNPAPEAAAT